MEDPPIDVEGIQNGDGLGFVGDGIDARCFPQRFDLESHLDLSRKPRIKSRRCDDDAVTELEGKTATNMKHVIL